MEEPSEQPERSEGSSASPRSAVHSEGRIPVELEDFQDPRKIFHHMDRVVELARTSDTRPVHMTIGLTNYCNHKCPWCYINWNQAGKQSARSGTEDAPRPAINADWRIVEAVRQAKDLGLKAVTIVGDGEPTLHPRFLDMLGALASLKIDIGIFTNLSTKKQAVLEALLEQCFFVRCSIDAARPEIHRRSHGADDFERIIQNLRRLVALRGEGRHPVIGIQYVVNQHNAHDLSHAAEFYRDLGVDYLTIKPAYKNGLNPAHISNDLTSDVALSLLAEAKKAQTDRYRVYAKTSQFKEVLGYETNDGRYYKKCLATPLSPYLDEDGSVEMCGNLKGRGFKLGNVFEQSFKEIWESHHRSACVKKIDLHKCPAGCKLDPLNKVLWDAIYPDGARVHTNFV